MNNYNILVVDDDSEIREAIKIYLKNEKMNIIEASNGEEALKDLENADIDLIIMDIMMPKMDGIKATFKIREDKNIPIIMLSAKSENTDKILGLNIGADDYITKPFNPLELVARVNSQLRRYNNFGHKESKDEIVVRGISLNKSTKTLKVNDEEVKLTPTEYKMLKLLMENKGRVFSISEIYTKVWKEPFINGENTVSVHIRRLREKIEINPKEPEYLKVVWGIGYKIEK
ncbi:response regulator transcription factor [Haloimpatiens sp. FM7315]|uniref:response regulator transcription factor n=1 Tax=Haloimpatiens sp. FM7315 TaxID=3298609 RepID=UPI0035A37F43